MNKRNNIGFLFVCGLIATFLSAYPIFFGKSYVSPGYGPQLLYDDLPLVPGYKSTDLEALGADAGAMPWAVLPYSRVQHQSIFVHEEFPLWNRYNSAGIPLFAQGQSMVLDPLHWIVIAGEGNGWAWDSKFLLAKLVFLLGLAACLFLVTQSRLTTFLIVVSAAFIGFFYYRFNHPAYFTMTYAPWVIFFYLRLLNRLKGSAREDLYRYGKWDWLSYCGITGTSLLLLFSGTPKEAFILFLAVHFAGIIGVLGVSRIGLGMLRNMGALISIFVVITLASAPHWLVFLDSLSRLSTIYLNPHCNFYSDTWGFLDTIYRGKNSLWVFPTVNIFLSASALLSVAALPRLYRRPEFWMVWITLSCLLLFAHGAVPNYICQKIPLVGTIHHIYDVCYAAAIIFAVIAAGLGLQEFFLDLRQGKRRMSWIVAVCLLFAFLAWGLVDRNYHLDTRVSIPTVLAVLSILGTILFFLLSVRFLKGSKNPSVGQLIVLGILFVLTHFYHGLHFPIDWDEELDRLILNPTPRADFLEPSKAVESLGYLLPTNPNFLEKECGEALPSDGFEAYVDRYPDLLKAFTRSGTNVKNKSDWGKKHYCKFGRYEGRTDWERLNSSEIIDSVLALSRSTNGRVDEIEKYKNDLERAIKSSSSYVHVQHHVAQFLKGVGADRWGAGPARVLGTGRTPMSGFYAFLKLESLNGPDAVMNSRYMELLDMVGWTRKGEFWLRTMNALEFMQHSALLDMLNVKYLLSWKKDLRVLHLAAKPISYSQSPEPPYQVNNGLRDEILSLRQVPSEGLDRVSCNPKAEGLQPDGREDNVYLVNLNELVYDEQTVLFSIGAMNLARSNPPGAFHTGDSNYVLGVSLEKDGPLVNQENGQISLAVTDSDRVMWIYSCRDGYDQAGVEYRLGMAIATNSDMRLVTDQDMKIWERRTPWPRAFFVDNVAFYQTNELADFVRNANGVPFAAVRSDKTMKPKTNREVVEGKDYSMTSNSTSFQIEAPSSGMVVLSETHIPEDIHVTVNGEPRDVIFVNHAFRGVYIDEPGHYTVSFLYKPRAWYLSWYLAIAGCLLLALLVYLSRRPTLGGSLFHSGGAGREMKIR